MRKSREGGREEEGRLQRAGCGEGHLPVSETLAGAQSRLK